MKNTIRKKPWLIPLFIIIGVAAVTAFGWIVMSLWNAVLVPAVGANIITFWQALGILVLSRILVGGFGGEGKKRHRGWKDKCNNMTEEEKQKFKEEIKQQWSGKYDNEQPPPESQQ
jgi:Ca2+/H+ antiporter, TMEM165/GDT1 family